MTLKGQWHSCGRHGNGTPRWHSPSSQAGVLGVTWMPGPTVFQGNIAWLRDDQRYRRVMLKLWLIESVLLKLEGLVCTLDLTATKETTKVAKWKIFAYILVSSTREKELMPFERLQCGNYTLFLQKPCQTHRREFLWRDLYTLYTHCLAVYTVTIHHIF